MDIETLDF